ncbi:MAG TPA: DUF362 domain-containing protein [Atribacteraceae bacterium]|nr:DUF362 domain-containing protein [Atribacteraceae bacterium]
MAKVALISCPDYERDSVQNAIEKGFACFGGCVGLFSPGERVLLKPNLLAGVTPEQAVTTHPEVFRAIAVTLLGTGVRVGYGDSPGYGNPSLVAEKAGLEAVAQEIGLARADFMTSQDVDFPEGRQHKKFPLAQGISQYDTLLSLPKWKTHGLTRITGAVKNQFGCVPGLRKTEYHFKMPDVEHFSRFLVDLNRFLRPRFCIMDAVMAMEGEGPRSGDPRMMGVIGFSDDPVALDAVFCRLIDVDPTLVPTCRWGAAMGLGEIDETRIVLAGDPLEKFVLRDFRVKRGPLESYKQRKLMRGLRRFVLARPRIEPKLCRLCAVCCEVCPAQPKALEMKRAGWPPVFHERFCIRCFCCQEMCPHRAITIHTPPLRRLIPLR